MSNITVKTMAQYMAEGKQPEVLFWVGCAGSFDDRAKKITRAFVKILNNIGVEFAVLGTEEHREYTEIWLNKHGFKYHGLLMGKPRGGNYHWVDNHLVKATRYNGKFTDLVEKNVSIQVFDDGEH